MTIWLQNTTWRKEKLNRCSVYISDKAWHPLTLLCTGFLSSTGSNAAALTLYSTSKRDTRVAKNCILTKQRAKAKAHKAWSEKQSGTFEVSVAPGAG